MQVFGPQPPQAMSSRHKPPVSAWAVFTTSLGCHHRMHLLQSVHPNLNRKSLYGRSKWRLESVWHARSYFGVNFTHNASTSSIHSYSQVSIKVVALLKANPNESAVFKPKSQPEKFPDSTHRPLHLTGLDHKLSRVWGAAPVLFHMFSP